MKWSDVANYVIPVLTIILPAARQVLPVMLQAINEAQRAFPNTDDKREAKRAAVFNAVIDAIAPAPDKPRGALTVGEAIAATQTVFTAIDALHAIAKAQQVSAAPAAPVKP